MWGSSSPDPGPVLTAYSQKLDKVRLNLTLSTDFADQHLFRDRYRHLPSGDPKTATIFSRTSGIKYETK